MVGESSLGIGTKTELRRSQTKISSSILRCVTASAKHEMEFKKVTSIATVRLTT